MLERTKLNFVQILPVLRKYKTRYTKLRILLCILLLISSQIKFNFSQFSNFRFVIFQTLWMKIKVKFSEFTFHLFIKLQENLFQVFVIIRIPLSRFFLNLIILKRAMFPYFWTFIFIIFSNYFSWIFSNHKFSFF